MRVGRVTPGGAVRHAFGIEERVERLDVEPFVDRVVRAEDERGVLAPARTRRGRQPILDHDIGDVRLQVRRKRRDRREAGKITGRVGDLGGGGEVSEGLEARPRDARHRDERQYAIPAGEIELRVEPLDLDDAGDVRVETGARGHPRDLSGGVGSGTLTCTVSFSTSLTPAQVQLESHHGLGPSYLERKVRTEPGPGVPIIVPGTREVSVLVVPPERRDLVEESGDRHLRRRRLRQDRWSQHRDGDEGEDCSDEEFPHYRLLKCGEQPFRTVAVHAITDITNSYKRPAGSGEFVPQHTI